MAIWEGKSSPVSPDMASAAMPPDAGEQSPSYWDYLKSGAQTADDFVRSAANAVTFGMADRLSGALPGGAGSTDAEVARSEAARQRSPVASLAGDITGSMAIPGLGGEALAARLGGRLGGRALGYGLEGAAVGAGQGAGNTYTGNLPDYVQNALIGGGIGAATGGVMGSIFGGRPPISMAKTPELGELGADTTKRYTTLNKNPTQYDASYLAQRANDLEKQLITGTGGIRGRFYRGPGNDPRASTTTFEALDEMRQPYQAAVRSGDPTAIGQISPEGIDYIRQGVNSIPHVESTAKDRASAPYVRRALDDFMENPPPGAVLPGYEATARDAAAQATIARQAHAAEMRAQTSNALRANALNNSSANASGLDVENALRKQWRPLLAIDRHLGTNALQREGFSPTEINRIQAFESGVDTPGRNLLRWAAKTAGGGSGLGALTALGAAGTYYGGTEPHNLAASVSLPLIGLGLRKAGNRLALHNMNSIDDMIRQRSPLFAERAAATGTRTPGYPGVANTGRNAIALELLRQQLAPTEDYANAP